MKLTRLSLVAALASMLIGAPMVSQGANAPAAKGASLTATNANDIIYRKVRKPPPDCYDNSVINECPCNRPGQSDGTALILCSQ